MGTIVDQKLHCEQVLQVIKLVENNPVLGAYLSHHLRNSLCSALLNVARINMLTGNMPDEDKPAMNRAISLLERTINHMEEDLRAVGL